MRTLIISKCLPYLAGPAVLAFEEARMLVEMGHEVDFVTYADYPSGATIEDFDEEVLSASGINFHPVVIHPTHKAVAPLVETALLSRAIEIVKRRTPDVVHAYYASPHGLVAVIVSWFFNIPSVVTLLGSDVHTLPRCKQFTEASRLVFNQADVLISVSRSLAQETLDLLGRTTVREVHVLPMAVDLDKFQPGARVPWSSGITLLYVGRLAKGKRLDVLVRAFAAVASEFPQAHLKIVGVGSEEGSLRRLTRKLGISSRVDFAGSCFAELPQVYQSADVFVLTSEKEGLPSAVCEAAASGLPIVTTPVGGIPDFFAEGRNCLYARIGDWRELAEAIKSLVGQPELMAKMGANNVVLARDYFDLAKRCRRFVRIVQNL